MLEENTGWGERGFIPPRTGLFKEKHMASIIILGNGTPQSKQEQIMTNIASLPTEAFVVKASNDAGPDGTIAGLRSAIEKSSDENILLLDDQVLWTREQLTQLMGASLQGASYAILPCPSLDSIALSDGIHIEDIISLCQVASRWPKLALLVSRHSLEVRLEHLRVESIGELISRCIIDALAQHEAISILPELSLSAEQEEEAGYVCSLSNASLSNLLRYAVNSVNIEELFPSHNWEEFSAESAAAGYHTISAQFIRLGDCPAALEAVALGDTLEDSPRSLALKGLIAHMQGETLQAVANMVSSLQEYERRKRDSEQRHFISFAPQNLDAIQSDLRSGLEALNKRDNGSALLHFRSAVFNFDSFYMQMGLK